MNTNKEDKDSSFAKLVTFNSSKDLSDFITKLSDIFLKHKNDKFYTYELSNSTFYFNLFNEKLCICNIKKISNPNWNSNCYYKVNNDNEKNITQNRIIIYKYTDRIIYFEKNGQIKLLESLLDENIYDITDIKLTKKINTPEKLHDEINKYLETNIIQTYKHTINDEFLKNNVSPINFENKVFTVNVLIEKYDNLVTNKLIDDDKKLPPYNYKECLDNRGYSTETKYNKLVIDKLPNRTLINTDTKLAERCEIADIIDLVNKLLYHIKKNKDLRVLAAQISIAVSLLKSPNKLPEVSEYIKINKIEDIDNFKYVFGIIQEKKNISLPNKLAIAMCCCVLEILKMDYCIDFIEYVK